MRYGWFVTGTDTGIGKTGSAVALLLALRRQGIAAIGMKPVATGGYMRDDRVVSEDAEALIAASSIHRPYEDINPYSYLPPVSPHLAAAHSGKSIQFSPILAAFGRLADAADAVVVEGAGGWLTPLDDRCTMADLAVALGLPVILVVGLRLGCINHALLSHRAIIESGTRLQGWIANDADASLTDLAPLVATLIARLGPPLAIFAHDPTGPRVTDLAPFLMRPVSM